VGSSGADQYQLRVITDTRYSTSSSDCEDLATSFPEDPLYGCQWHLKNTGQWKFNGRRITAGEDIKVEGVWNDEIFGSGINVAVVDDGLDIEHEDLADNVNSDLNHDYSGNDNVFNPESGHGTRVAGVIAAVADNELGVRGVAPQASIYNYNLVGSLRLGTIANAMTRNHIITAVSNNSWGSIDSPSLKPVGRAWEMAVETGIREGFGGKGVFYSWIAGNGYSLYDQANFDGYSNYYAVTTVCSVDGFGMSSSFSEEGINIWICVPGSNITTTDNDDLYNSGVSGTSYAAPIVSGVVTLMREVNSDLSWRDLKLILAASARKTDPGWETVAVKYGSDTENYNYNPKYGFGVVDASAAVELAGNWNRVPQMRTLMASSGDIDIAIPDHTGGVDGEIVSKLTIPDTDDLFTEFVEINLTFTHAFFPELDIQITSPDGTVSQLSEEHIQVESILSTLFPQLSVSYTDFTHRFGSAKHLGEDPAGEWTLRISDARSNNTGTLHSWSIKVYGHRSSDTVPTFGSGTITDKEYYATVTATTETLPLATGGDGTLTYSLTPALPAGLNFNAATREISGTPTNATNKITYTYTVTDDDGDTDQITFGITVGADMPTFGSETITDKEYVKGKAITETLPLATGGDGTLTYSLTPALPSGLSFTAATREISGTPTNATPRTDYTYTVTDDDGDTDQITFGITVETDSVPDFGSETITDKEYVNGTAVAETLPVATRGNGTLRYSLTPSLPYGLSFNSVTRVMSGTPDTAFLFWTNTYTYTVTDEDGDTDELTFRITVETDSMPNFGDTITDQQYIARTPTNLPVTLPVATGGDPPVTYSITPRLPAGLRFNSNTRRISGTPTTATPRTDYTYTVTDDDGDTDQITFGITVEANAIPNFGDTIDDKGYVTGTTVTETLPLATGGSGVLRYSLIPALPSGLNFNENTRVISGTPTRASSGTYTYTVTDKNGDTAEVSFILRVTDPPDRRTPPGPTPDTESGGGGGCTISDQNNIVSDLFGVMACLMLIPVSVVIRRKRITQIKT